MLRLHIWNSYTAQELVGHEHIAKKRMSWVVPEDHHLIGILRDMSD